MKKNPLTSLMVVAIFLTPIADNQKTTKMVKLVRSAGPPPGLPPINRQ
jgi:hypothetical protein